MGEKLNGDFEIEPKIFTKILVAVDEDTRVDGVLGLFHELFEEGFEG